MAPWWLRASDDEQLADSPAELEAFAHEEDPIVDLPPTLIVPRILAEEPEDDAIVAAGAPIGDDQAGDDLAAGDDDADSEGEGDAEGPAEAGEAGGAKAGGVRRRRRRRRGRRPGEGAPAAAEPASAESPGEIPQPAVAAVPLFDSPPAASPAPAAASPVVSTAESGWPPMAEPALAATPKAEAPAPPPASEPAPPAEPVAAPPFELPAARVAPPPPQQQPPQQHQAAPRKAHMPAPPRQPAAEKPPSAPLARAPRAGEPRVDLAYGAPDIAAMPIESFPKGAYVYTLPERPSSPADERKIAMFVDFENIALGVRDSEVRTFDMTLILERLLEKGKIIVKKAYADWERYSEYKRPFHEAAIELIDIPQKFYSGKNSADIKMVVDAMDLCYSKEHLDTFVLVSGDSDFSPLVSKLKENNKYVIGLGVKNSSSSLLIDNCDEFIYYEDVWRDTQRVPRLDHLAPKEAECFQLMCESIVALLRENKEVLWGSLVKQTMQRKRPSFSEGYYGYGTFTELLEDAERKNIIRLRRDQRSGTYIVVGFVPPRAKRSFQV